MAKDKKSFLLYCDLIHVVNKLTNEKAGELFKHLLAYVNDEDPQTDDVIIDLVFEPIKQSLKRDLKKYKEIQEKRSAAGKKSAKNRSKSTSVNTSQQVLTNSTVNDNVNVSVNVNDINTYQYLKENYTSRIETFEMQNKNNIDDYEKFTKVFNQKVILEDITEPKKQFARLELLKTNWKKEKSSDKKEKRSAAEIIKEVKYGTTNNIN